METVNPKITHIERIQIKGLWGKYDVDWQLNQDVNILIGINGSGKSTVLELVLSIVTGGKTKTLSRINLEEIHLTYNNQKILEVKKHKNTSKGFYIYHLIKINDELSYHFHGNDNFFELEQGKINIDRVSTFDEELLPLEAIQKLSNESVITFLDWELYNLIFEYKGFQSKILNRFKNKKSKDKKKDIFEKDDLFRKLINELFSKTNKTILVNDESDIHFKIGNRTISPFELSSGEKQMFIILLKVLIQDNQPYILLMDEPEISLHLSWQADLIDNIRKLNENCQLIIATHAPSIIKNGWNDKVTKMDDILIPILVNQ